MRFHSNFILFYISTNSTHCLQFLHFLASTCYFLCFWMWPSWQVWGGILWFWYVFPWWLVNLIIFFICFLSLCIFFWRNICSSHSYFLIWLFSCCWVLEVLYIFWILILNLFGCVISSTVSHSGDCLFVILFELKHSSKRNFISYWAYFGMRPIGKKARPVLLKAVVFLWE